MNIFPCRYFSNHERDVLRTFIMKCYYKNVVLVTVVGCFAISQWDGIDLAIFIVTQCREKNVAIGVLNYFTSFITA